ncbi:MAG: error-prone DNA polymerase, partial [Anaerolineae bacterium]|nr:error-prone DNA polymerase [Anaerolineae bacterium]
LDQLTFDDPQVYQMISEADTIGVFQVESRAQAQMLPRLQPRCFNDLVVAISLIRPGPIQGNMVHPYLRRRLKLEPVTYPHPRLEPALAETLGVILFQEQVLKVARDLAGFTPGQGEHLRRAMGAKHAEAEIDRFQADFIAGAQAQGVPIDIAEAVFDQLRAFGGYAFAKSHAAAFSVLVYQSAWLKYYYPAAFLTGILNHQPMGFWQPAVLVGDAQRRGLTVLSVYINLSLGRCTVQQEHLRLGLNYVKGLGDDAIDRILTARAERSFISLADFCRRTRLARRLVEHLIMAGAMDGWGKPRRRLLWELGGLDYREESLALDVPLDNVSFPELTPVETMLWEQQVLGLSTGDHVMTLYRAWLDQNGILGSRQLATCHHGQQVRIAGLLVVRQSPPTAKGVVFLTLEDEEALMNVIVYPHVFKRYQILLRSETLLIVTGEVQRGEGVVDVLASMITIVPQ